MKKSFAILAMTALLLPAISHAQDRLRERDLEGTTWKMVFDINNERNKKDADNAFERIILSAVDGLMDEIDIYFEFGRRGKLTVWVDVFGEEDEDEASDWRISRDGFLELGETDSFESGDTVWMRDGDRLIPYERKRGGRLEKEGSIYLKRID